MLTQARASLREPISTSDWGGRTTRAEVDLDALAWNVTEIRRLVRPAELMAVVKANAYGHGAVPIARAATEAGAERLAVYTVSEGLELREAGIEAPILVMGPFEEAEVEGIVKGNLTPTILSIEAGEQVTRYRASHPSMPGARGIPRWMCHVKIDTGLSRSGIPSNEAVEFVRSISNQMLGVEGIYTHFASADEPDGGLTARQLDLFLRTIGSLETAGYHPRIKHAAGTAAAFKFPETRLDAIRCGIGIYGYYPGDAPHEIELRPVLSLLSSITRIVEIGPGEGVGYGHEFLAQRPSRIGLVPIGYGDGVPRELGKSNGRVLVQGAWAPIVGRVSMDQISIDITDRPRAEMGDRVTLIGRDGGAEQTADELATAAGTISYDILTRIMPRVPRLYRRGSELSTTG